jgi:DNA-binding transcriptional MerR regulator
MIDQKFTIQQVAERTGLSIHTLRFYEQKGLLGAIERQSNGHRRYSEANIRWASFLKCLRAAGMPLVEIERFTRTMQDDEIDATLENRRVILESHHRYLSSHLRDVQKILDHIETKLSSIE